MFVRKRQSQTFPARELAWLLIEIVHRGIECRARERCLGVGIAKHARAAFAFGQSTADNASTPRATTRVETRKAIKHARRGHDSGCETLGVSLAELAQFLRAYDSADAQALLQEAIDLSVEEIQRDSELGSWSADAAREIFDLHLRRRITPLIPNSKGRV